MIFCCTGCLKHLKTSYWATFKALLFEPSITYFCISADTTVITQTKTETVIETQRVIDTGKPSTSSAASILETGIHKLHVCQVQVKMFYIKTYDKHLHNNCTVFNG